MNDTIHVIWRLAEDAEPSDEATELVAFAGREPVAELTAVPRRWPDRASPPRPLIRPSLLDQVYPPGIGGDGRAGLRGTSSAVAPDPATAEQLIVRLREDPQVDADSVDTITRVRSRSPLRHGGTETFFQGYLDDESRGGVGLAAVHGLAGWLGDAVKLAVVEGGWKLPHPDLPDDVQQPEVFGSQVMMEPTSGDRRHGNNVLGVLVGRRNGVGVDGLVPEAGLTLVRYGRVRDDFLLEDYNIFEAITSAIGVLSANGGGVLVLAADGERLEVADDGALMDSPRLPLEAWETARQLFRRATESGIHVVIAAGNGFEAVIDDHCTKGGSYPSGALVVGAGRAREREILSVSNRGRERVDLHSWGHRVATTDGEGYTDNFNGTSSATAIVAGVVGLLASHFRRETGGASLSPENMRRLLVTTGFWEILGIGPRPNLRRAVQRLREVGYDQSRL